MIEQAIQIIAEKLNRHLKNAFSSNENLVEVSNIVGQDGAVSPNVDNKLVLFVVNIEQEILANRHVHDRLPGPGRVPVISKPAYMNIYICLAGTFSGKNYSESLKLLSHAIGFLHNNCVFDHSNTPELDPVFNKLVFEYVNLDIRDLSNLWGVITGKYLPSALYKVRMVPVGVEQLTGQDHAIHGGSTAVNRKD